MRQFFNYWLTCNILAIFQANGLREKEASMWAGSILGLEAN